MNEMLLGNGEHPSEFQLDASNSDASEACPVPYDENLLERAKTQWQFGDWASLRKITKEILQHHPDRAKLALTVAAGHLQGGDNMLAKRFIRLAQDWGIENRLLSRILIAGVHNSLGRAAAIENRHSKAVQHFRNAISIGTPGSDARLLSQARSTYQFFQLGIEYSPYEKKRAERSTARIENGGENKEQRSTTELAAYLNENGESLYRTDNFKLATEYFYRSLDLQPNNAWVCQNLAEALARTDFKNRDSWECELLAESMAKYGRWDVVVRYYRQALKLDPIQVEVHKSAQTFQIQEPREGHIDNPIFIVGCGHSGTSLLLAIIGNHPHIYPIPKESGVFLKSDESIQNTMRQWDSVCQVEGKSRWVEKTPPHIFQIHRFLSFRPKAQIILMLRDGRDVVCSLKPRIGYAAFQDRLDRWVYDNMAGLPYWDHPQVKVVKYEDIVAAPEATMSDICQFLGEEFHSQVLEYHKTERRWYNDKIEKPEVIRTHADHNANRNWQINQPIFDGRGRWHGEMTEAEKKLFKDSPAQQLLEKFGYASGVSW